MWFDQSTIHDIHEKALSVGLEQKRDLLLPKEYLGRLPRKDVPAEQLLSDLNELNKDQQPLSDGMLPLERWLLNAAYQARQNSNSNLALDFDQRRSELRRAYMQSPAWVQTNAPIVPKGLQSFDGRDSSFFLRLLDSPRDAEGIPESILFWKTKLEETDPDNTFRIGLLFGPSGCGKSSFVRAGLIPLLSENVRPIYLEATPDHTEANLQRTLRKAIPELTNESEESDIVATMRATHGFATDSECNVVVFLDQFEQWLQEWDSNQPAPLMEALRVCDGRCVQAVVLVRDDYYLRTDRFFREINTERTSVEDQRCVDSFKRTHAEKVLLEFGKAYGRIDNTGKPSAEQTQFVNRLLDELKDDDGMYVAVQLALVAYMLRQDEWTGESLANLGGAVGLGQEYLKQNFDRKRTARPAYLKLRDAAAAVLRALLPPPGSDIKGASKSRGKLITVCNNLRRPVEFNDLVSVLENELKLISKSATEEKSVTEPHYQLTHDYLVPSIRAWLRDMDTEGWRNKAAALLRERTRAWVADDQNPRHYPSASQLILIRLGVPKKHWSADSRRLVAKASRLRALQKLRLLLLMLLPVAAWITKLFFTYELTFARDNKYQRQELRIVRSFDPRFEDSRFELHTWIFRDDLNETGIDAVARNLVLNTGLEPSWSGIPALLESDRRWKAELGWLGQPISQPDSLLGLLASESCPLGDIGPPVLEQVTRDVSSIVLSLPTRDRKQYMEAASRLLDPKHSKFKRIYAIDTLGLLDNVSDVVVTALTELLHDKDVNVRVRVAVALAKLDPSNEAAVTALTQLLKVRGHVCILAADALGQIRLAHESTIATLTQLLGDTNGNVRIACAEALGRIGTTDDRAIAKLRDLLDDSAPKFVRIAAVTALLQIGMTDDLVISELTRLLQHPEALPRNLVTRALADKGISDTSVIAALIDLYKSDPFSRSREALLKVAEIDNSVITQFADDEDIRVRHLAVEALRIGKSDSKITTLVHLLKDEESSVRALAAEALGEIGNSGAVVLASLTRLLNDETSEARSSAALALGKIGEADEAVILALTELLNASTNGRAVGRMIGFRNFHRSSPRAAAATALGEIGTAKMSVVAALMRFLNDQDRNLRFAAVNALAKLGKPRGASDNGLIRFSQFEFSVMSEIDKLLEDEDTDVRLSAIDALARIEVADNNSVAAKLVELMNDRIADVRVAAARALGKVAKSDDSHIRALGMLLKDKNPNVRDAAANGLREIFEKSTMMGSRSAIKDLQSNNSCTREIAGIRLAYQQTYKEKMSPDIKLVREITRLRETDSRPWVKQAAFRALVRINRRRHQLEEKVATVENTSEQFSSRSHLHP